jgi:hypothetical protein
MCSWVHSLDHWGCSMLLFHQRSRTRGIVKNWRSRCFFFENGHFITLSNRPGLCIARMHTAVQISCYKTSNHSTIKTKVLDKKLARWIQAKITLPPMLEKNIPRRILQPWRHLHKEVSMLHPLKRHPWAKRSCASVYDLHKRGRNIIENLVIST